MSCLIEAIYHEGELLPEDEQDKLLAVNHFFVSKAYYSNKLSSNA
ncbi:hypothetical protein ABNX05_00860 [Lysinibacillus sp. M3]|uniref:Uncharacterized protein n=1 Tax=Lysinibacillus zambalensis TaxID=3160866 RepID=A0ABV1MKY2_9BACI